MSEEIFDTESWHDDGEWSGEVLRLRAENAALKNELEHRDPDLQHCECQEIAAQFKAENASLRKALEEERGKGLVKDKALRGASGCLKVVGGSWERQHNRVLSGLDEILTQIQQALSPRPPETKEKKP